MKSNALKMFCVWVVFSVFIVTSAHAGGSIQAMGSWWDSGESESSFGFGLRGSIGSSFALDLGWTYYAGDDISFDLPNDQEVVISDGIDTHVFDLGARYTFPIELYLGGGASYFVLTRMPVQQMVTGGSMAWWAGRLAASISVVL